MQCLKACGGIVMRYKDVKKCRAYPMDSQRALRAMHVPKKILRKVPFNPVAWFTSDAVGRVLEFPYTGVDDVVWDMVSHLRYIPHQRILPGAVTIAMFKSSQDDFYTIGAYTVPKQLYYPVCFGLTHQCGAPVIDVYSDPAELFEINKAALVGALVWICLMEGYYEAYKEAVGKEVR